MTRLRCLSALSFLGGSAVLIGCGTIKSKIYDSDNVTEGRQIKHLRGIPETVDVPTHIKITVYETRYYRGPTAQVSGSGAAKGVNAVSGIRDNYSPESSNAMVNSEQIQTLKNAQFNNQIQVIESKKILNQFRIAEVKPLESAKADVQKKLETNSNDDVLKAKLLELEALLLKAQAKINSDAAAIAEFEAAIAALQTQLDAANKAVAERVKYTATGVEPTRQMKYEIISKKELFAVDFKRPISGKSKVTLAYGDASDGQFFKQVDQVITDTSIKDIGELVSQIATALPKLAAIGEAANQQAAALGLHAVNSVVAVEYFDVHTPHVEQQIQEFLDRNVNCCSPACGHSQRPLPAPSNAPPAEPQNCPPVPATTTGKLVPMRPSPGQPFPANR